MAARYLFCIVALYMLTSTWADARNGPSAGDSSLNSDTPAAQNSAPTETSSVVILNNKNFEHYTQAASGATTGDWFIKFYAPWCGHCKKMAPAWEELATNLKGKINVAKVNTEENSKLAKRFSITGFPTLIFFHQGKMYKYNSGDRSVPKLEEFATSAWQKEKPEDVAADVTTVDMIKMFLLGALGKVQRVYVHAPDAFWILALVGVFVGLLLGMVLCLLFGFLGVSGKRSSRKTRSKKKD